VLDLSLEMRETATEAVERLSNGTVKSQPFVKEHQPSAVKEGDMSNKGVGSDYPKYLGGICVKFHRSLQFSSHRINRCSKKQFVFVTILHTATMSQLVPTALM
jgi:hypothetical protein